MFGPHRVHHSGGGSRRLGEDVEVARADEEEEPSEHGMTVMSCSFASGRPKMAKAPPAACAEERRDFISLARRALRNRACRARPARGRSRRTGYFWANQRRARRGHRQGRRGLHVVPRGGVRNLHRVGHRLAPMVPSGAPKHAGRVVGADENEFNIESFLLLNGIEKTE